MSAAHPGATGWSSRSRRRRRQQQHRAVAQASRCVGGPLARIRQRRRARMRGAPAVRCPHAAHPSAQRRRPCSAASAPPPCAAQRRRRRKRRLARGWACPLSCDSAPRDSALRRPRRRSGARAPQRTPGGLRGVATQTARQPASGVKASATAATRLNPMLLRRLAGKSAPRCQPQQAAACRQRHMPSSRCSAAARNSHRDAHTHARVHTLKHAAMRVGHRLEGDDHASAARPRRRAATQELRGAARRGAGSGGEGSAQGGERRARAHEK
jgi:hypothetical protein